MGLLQTVNFRMKTYKELFLSHLQDAYNQGLLSSDNRFMDYINNREDIENNYVMQSSVHNKTLATAYEDMQLIYNALDIDNAANQDLDYIGELLGIVRFSAQSSATELYFFLKNNATTNISIPAGTLADCMIYAGQTGVTVTALSASKGENSHVNKGELTYIISESANFSDNQLYVYNTIASTGGRVRETDDEYRLRIKKWPYILKRGTIDCYLNYLESFEGLNDYNLIPLWDGSGTLKIVTDPGTEDFIQSLLEGLIENVILADDDVTIIGSDEIPIDIYTVVNVTIDNPLDMTSDEKTALTRRIKELIATYIDGGIIYTYEQISYYKYYGDIQEKVYEDAYKINKVAYSGLGIGENFIPQKCAEFIDEQLNFEGNNPVKNIEFNIPSSFTADSLTDYYGDIDDEETATTGNITVVIT